MSIVYRGLFSTLWITLQASEELGLVAGDYLQDYFGNSGQVSIYHLDTDTYYPLVMIEVPEDTPQIPHDVFVGQTSLAGLPNGAFEIRGRVRDVAGNYSILSAVLSPFGGEQVVALGFSIAPGSGVIFSMSAGGALMRLGLQVGGLTAPGGGTVGLTLTAGLSSNIKWSF